MARAGNSPKKLLLPMLRILSSRPLTVRALLIILMIPLMMVDMPRVAIIGGTLKS